jgi:micrococcal nuclease
MREKSAFTPAIRAAIGRFFAALLVCCALLSPALAQQIAGKVVGVSDGDTITVLTAEKKQFKIRLNGIDCPESAQPFGQAAKQFTSKAVFGKDVTAVVKDTDRYGRTVAVILGPDGANLNQSLVKNGYAWWYRQYAPNDLTLKQLEWEAREAKRGLWAEPKTAIAPWEWRKGVRPASAVPRAATVGNARSGGGNPTTARSVQPITRTVYITDTGAKYHEAGCRHLSHSQHAISLKDAEAQGYTPCKHCH